MKEVILQIDDDVWAEIRSGVAVKGMAAALYGTVDAFMVKLIKEVDKGSKTVTFSFKKKEKKSGDRTT